ncbi:SpoIIE family protein phosphatase [Umezawaea beigongshangensis]|uniref:SpoIIE family protein phosphatase n=1 Tax=Umezawaea beigongshangensis TaxID=2780383 RepID=UPI0027DD30C1|nr:SpoIIE family protein phosphatase [Umezawaea beigongshangensis]
MPGKLSLTSLGEMGSAIAGKDWASTPIGPIEQWPRGLRTAISTCLPSRIPMLLWWGPTLVQLYNDAYQPFLGDKHPASLGQPAAECWAEAWHELGPMADGVLAGGEATYSENQLLFINRHGYLEETYWTFSYSPILDDDGAVQGIFVATSDTTRRVLSERRLRTVRELGAVSTTEVGSAAEACRAVLDVLAGHRTDVPFALAHLFDDDGDDAALVASYGIAADEDAASAVLPRALVDPALREVATTRSPRLISGLREHVAAGFEADGALGSAVPDQAMVLPLTASGHTGVLGVLVLAISPYRAVNEDYLGFFDLVSGQVSTALTDALAYVAERERSAALAELDRAKSDFFANVSHELRTPLTLIAGPAADALADTAAPLLPAQRQRLELIQRNARLLRRLVDELLDFARIEAGGLQPRFSVIDLAELTREITESFAPAVLRAGLGLEVDWSELSRPAVVDVDMWEKILLNLLSNAVKYTPRGGVRVSLAQDGDHAVLRVADTGVGVPADELPLLFQRFHRVRSTRGRSHEGAGIGLALVRELVALHGGTVSATSAEGAGATFTVRVPLDSTAARDAPEDTTADARSPLAGAYLEEALRWSAADEPEAPAEDDDADPARAVVLVVEDNVDMRGLLTRLLRPHYRVLLAGDGRAGLAAAREHRPDLVLSDVMMPELDGLGLLHALRRDPTTAAIPVVFLSARAGEDAAVVGLDAGADDYLPKPFSTHELIARVRANVELSRLRRGEAEFRRALVDSLQEGFFVADHTGAIVEINSAWASITGYGPESLPHLAPYPWLADPETRPDLRSSQDEAMNRLAEDGCGDFVIPLCHRDGHVLWVALSSNSIEGDGGRIFVGTLRDVTAERSAALRQSALHGFAVALAAATDVTEVLDAGIAGLRPVLGASSAVAAVWPSDADDGVIVGAPSGGFADLPPMIAAALDDARRHPVASVNATPGPGGEGVLGLAAPLDGDAAVWLGFPPSHSVSAEDRSLFALLASHLAQALLRARSYDQARTVALTLQHAMLGPTELPPGFAVRYEPAVQPLEVGGDWYDVVPLPGGRIGVVVGDCVGHGLAAAAVMGQLRSSCRALMLRGGGPAQVLQDLDAFAEQIPGAMCTTVFCAVIEPSGGVLRYSSAGHPPAVLGHAGGGGELLEGARSLPLGVDATTVRGEETAELKIGSVLLLYTDGLVERRGVPLDDGVDATRDVVASGVDLRPSQLADRLLAELLPAGGHDDDVALVVYRHPPVPLRLEMPGVATQLAPMRARLREWLAGAEISEEVSDEVVLAVGEACANAVEHGYADGRVHPVLVTASAEDGALELAVADRGIWKPPGDDPGYRGRGIEMMRAFMDEVEVLPGEGGTVVRMRRAYPA